MLSSLAGGLLSRTAISNTINQVEVLAAACLHTSSVNESRIKTTARHKAFWHVKKLNKATDAPITEENKQFIQSYIDKKYSGPLKEEYAPWAKGKFEPEGTRRPGVLAVKIGVQPMWLKNGKQITATLLHVKENHVVKYQTIDEYARNYLSIKKTNPSFVKNVPPNPLKYSGYVSVGAISSDPQKYTKDYCGLFSECGLAPKRHLARFPVTENAVIQPGTPLTAAHFVPGQYVDIYGRTMERGFHGVMKRWGFKGMPKTHGVTKSHRRPGCIGSGRDKGRVWPGQKMPGNVGGKFHWVRGLRVLRINYAENVLYVIGPNVQGENGSVVHVCDTSLKAKRWESLKKEDLTAGPRFFPTAYPDQMDDLPEEEYFNLVHNFKDLSLKFA